ncbi:AAA family ATPase [Kribbella sp. NPDC048915]|uniref:AAA family ATPase n=1 Tax=Kribbella sp. NPDC048915 TaxID=3155148 RepID=UPI003400ED5B
MPFATHPVRRVAAAEGIRLSGQWPHTIPAVRQLLTDGLDLDPGVTFLVGENGTGKSTLVEAIAVAFGMSPEGGSTGARLTTRVTESSLADELLLTRGIGGKRAGFFLRAETMHGFYSYLERNPKTSGPPEPVFHEMSHGESFLSLINNRFVREGFYCLDEPESALSFASTCCEPPGMHKCPKRGSAALIQGVLHTWRYARPQSVCGGRVRRGGSGAREPSGAMCSKIWSTRLRTCGSSTV